MSKKVAYIVYFADEDCCPWKMWDIWGVTLSATTAEKMRQDCIQEWLKEGEWTRPELDECVLIYETDYEE